jgi:aspartate dehydrogenase
MKSQKEKGKRKKLKVGIIGCGAMGSEIALACTTRLREKIDLVGICDIDADKANALAGKLKDVLVMERAALIAESDLVVESASAKISSAVVKECLEKAKDVLVMSVGGLLGQGALLADIRRAASRVYLPSGAICGMDGIKAAAIGKIRSARLTTRKPPKSLAGAPYITEKRIDLDGIRHETVIFEGRPQEAVLAFPQNINVSATLSLAAIGADDVRVKIMTSPEYTANIHEIEVEGEFGRLVTRTENLPSPANPKTSRLAIFSAIATLERIVSNLEIGT